MNFEIRNKADKAEIWVYGNIGEDFWGEGITAKSFTEDINAIKAAQIDIHINSGGGSVFDGQAIYNAIQRHPARKTSYIDGVAASIASVLALGADEVVMAKNALYMIHDPWGMAMGSAKDIRSYADILDKVRDTIVGVYVDKTLTDRSTIEQMMEEETWMTAQEAYDHGFVDRIGDELKLAACDVSSFNYRHLPVAQTEEEPIPDVQHAEEGEAEAAEPQGMSEIEYLELSL